MEFLYWLEGLRTPFLDTVFGLITHLGEELLFIVAAVIMLWCVDKYEGYLLMLVGFLGTQINQFLKVTFRIPRPWVLDPQFHAVESAIPEATGYSFPSGHTQSAVGMFGSIAAWNRRWGLRIACILIALLVAFSRMYLGVHTPLDVGVSIGVAVVLVAAITPVMRRAQTTGPKTMRILLAVMAAISIAQAVYMTVTLHTATEPELQSGLKNAYKMLGATLGMIVVYEWDVRVLRFDTKAVWWAQILKVVLGLALTLGIKELCYLVFGLIPSEPISRALSYFVMVLFAGGVWPMTFRFFGKLGKKSA